MKVAFATTCRGRLCHLSLTLPKNLSEQADAKDCVFVVLDYNDQEGLPEYIQREHSADLDSGRLVYYRTNDPPRFHMAKAKNQAHRCAIMEGAAVLVNCDSDNWLPKGFGPWVQNKFASAEEDCEAIFIGTRGNHRGPGSLTGVKTPPGCFGRIGVTTQAFRHAGGYAEEFADWSPDDRDFAQRVSNLGYGWRQIRPCFLGAIKHGAGLRFREYEPAEGSGFDEAAVLATRADMRIANAGNIGTGVVYRNFSKEPIEITTIPTRVFGLGLHKTGTTSLTHAFRMLGYDAAHWESPHWARYVWQEMKAAGKSRTLEMHYALSDLPIPLLYRELDHAYPGSKFILTVRDEDEWLNSIRVHWQAMRQGWDNDVFSNEIHRELYGTTEFDEQVFRNRYRRHNEDVMAYFRGRPDFMVLEIAPETQMGTFCRFLGVTPMGRKFPHRHKSAEQAKYRGVG
jgi:hypothetical protein